MTKRVLVCDDEPHLRDMIASHLCMSGYTVIEALDGYECLEHLQKEAPDLLFLDLNIPKIDGMEVLSRMKTLGITCPVVIITGFADSRMLGKTKSMGVKAILNKPFNLGSLDIALTSLCKND